jgi:hypothetical protein
MPNYSDTHQNAPQRDQTILELRKRGYVTGPSTKLFT